MKKLMSGIENKSYSDREKLHQENLDIFLKFSALMQDIRNKYDKILYGSVIIVGVLTAGDYGDNNNQISQEIDTGVGKEQDYKITDMNTSTDFCKSGDLLGYVDKNNDVYLCRELIHKQAKEYHLNEKILTGAIEKNELGSHYFTQYISQVNIDIKGSKFSYRQIGEIAGDVYTVQYLSEQKETIASLRIFNELLRSKQNMRVHGDVNDSDFHNYDLIHKAAEHSYKIVFGEEYTQEGMIRVTKKIDQKYYNETVLVKYKNELIEFINGYAQFDMRAYQKFLDSQEGGDMIVQNNIKNKRKLL